MNSAPHHTDNQLHSNELNKAIEKYEHNKSITGLLASCFSLQHAI
jgi:hypothetical protein